LQVVVQVVVIMEQAAVALEVYTIQLVILLYLHKL
jgi:hypothetical protein